MRLMSLKLSGFKSFVDSTTLVFPASRTAVVGPNGCGKSNVIDAIRWVMGESSARQLRGGAMTDVIFAGTSQRKPVGQASVELRFENTQGKLGGEYNAYTELSVRRQVSRDGRSEYFLNGTRCRRRDITDIFLGTGLGPRSYAIIEQGMINRLVDAKPDEMRVFIEEAAGVSRYQARRRETMQHLEHTRQNLSRLQDIEDELQSQMRSLKRQSQAAIKYHELEQQQLELNAFIWSAHYIQAEQAQQQHTQQLTQLGEQYRELRSARNQAEADWQAGSQLLSTLLGKAEPIQQTWQQAERELSQLEAQIQQYQQEQRQREQQAQQWQYNLQAISAQVVEDQQQLRQLSQSISNNQQEQQQAEQALTQAAQHLAQVEEQHQHLEQSGQKTRQQYQHHQQNQQRLQQHLDGAARSQLRLEQQLQQATGQLERLQDQQQQEELDDLNLEHSELLLEKTGLEQQQTRQQQQSQQTRQAVDELNTKLQHLQHERQQYQSERKALQKLQNPASASARSHASSIQLLQQLSLHPLAQPHVQLLEKFLADWLSAELYDDFTQAGLNEQPASARGYMQVRTEITDSHSACLQHPDVTALNQWIKAPLLSCWSAVGIVGGHAQALALQKKLNAQQSLLSMDGFWLGKNWQINLNIDEQAARQQGLLQQQLRQQELEQLLTQLDHYIAPLEQQQQALSVQQASQQASLKILAQRLSQTSQQLQQLELKQARLESHLQVVVQQVEQLKRQQLELQQNLQDDQEQVAEWQMELAEATMRLDQLSPQLQAQQQQQAQLQQQLQEARLSHQLKRQHLQQLQASQHNLNVQLQAAQQALLRAEPQQQQIQQQLEQLKLIAVQADEHYPVQLERLVHCQEQAKLAHSNWSEWQQQLEFQQQAQQRLSHERQQGQTREDQLRDQLEQTRLHWQDCKNKMEQAREQLDSFKAELIQVDVNQLADWQQQLEKVQHQIQKLGHLNLAAPEALQEVNQRHAALEHQIQDLQQTIDQLEQAMKSIDQETRTLFMSTFDQVNTELKVLFPKVFGGGEASLSLEDDWQSGVKLMARPPGKRNSSLALLSGGEKALTALALVFAIFRLNPAPFCVLDEVDAPLDDANVQRFCHLVKELSQQVQFIYITHNKLAMTMATDLLGVTMPEPGASRLVAVNIEQAAKFSATSE
ncbi:chromosome segregation protein SMC [Alkanindiges sp. WGS2144]|uniref:chromosome segregation protein SMC n=1 Tax=Alkanindiges sp. WGS2144 TaxID=3366808 RepID=UPI0037505510